jgi:hypothetical protein
MRPTRLLLLALAGVTAAARPAHAASPVLDCDVHYAGAQHRVQARPVTDPYTVPATDIDGRFRFKAVMVRGPGLVERIGVYVYFVTERQPVLVQHARYLPPWPTGRDGQPADLTGEQRLYAGPIERELIYRCRLSQAQP